VAAFLPSSMLFYLWRRFGVDSAAEGDDEVTQEGRRADDAQAAATADAQTTLLPWHLAEGQSPMIRCLQSFIALVRDPWRMSHRVVGVVDATATTAIGFLAGAQQGASHAMTCRVIGTAMGVVPLLACGYMVAVRPHRERHDWAFDCLGWAVASVMGVMQAIGSWLPASTSSLLQAQRYVQGVGLAVLAGQAAVGVGMAARRRLCATDDERDDRRPSRRRGQQQQHDGTAGGSGPRLDVPMMETSHRLSAGRRPHAAASERQSSRSSSHSRLHERDAGGGGGSSRRQREGDAALQQRSNPLQQQQKR
jgi:hypothetical protein